MIKEIAGSALTMIAMDAVWLTLNYTYHTKLIENAQKSALKLRIIPALLVYLLLPFAVYYLAVEPIKNIKEAALRGALLGLAIYGTYDLTNLATFTGWTYEMLVRDTTWGTVLCTMGAAAGYYFGKTQ